MLFSLSEQTGACVQWNITENGTSHDRQALGRQRPSATDPLLDLLTPSCPHIGYYEECGPANKCFTSEDFEQVCLGRRAAAGSR